MQKPIDEFKNRFNKIISIRDMKPVELAEKTGLSKSTISHYMSGYTKPKSDRLYMLAKTLNVNEAWLMGYDVAMEGEPSLEEIITSQIKKQGTTLEDVAEKADVAYEWLKDIGSFVPGKMEYMLDDPKNYPSPARELDWDEEISISKSYEWISRVADVLGLSPSILRAALARQEDVLNEWEIPIPDDLPNVSAREAFGTPYTEPVDTDKTDSIQPTPKEQGIIIKYRSLDTIGQNHVESVLDWETDRIQQLRGKDSLIYELETSNRIYPYLGKIACAGTGFYFDDIPTDTIKAPYVEDADFIIGVSGESMEPDYHDGEKLYVRKVEYLRNGDIGIFTIGNEYFLKELGEDGLISRNKDYNDIPGDEKVRLVGKVIGKVEI